MQILESIRMRRSGMSAALVMLAIVLTGCQENVEFTRKPVQQAQRGDQPTVRSPVYVVARSDATPLIQEAVARIPERLTRISRRLARAACVEVNGRKRCSSARVRGEIVRNGEVKLVGSPTGFALHVPASYKFTIQGSGAARSVNTTTSGKFTIKAPYTVTLDGTWHPIVDYDGQLDLGNTAEIPILEKSLDISRPLTRSLRARLRRLARPFEDALDTTEAVGIVEKTWRHLHYPVQLKEKPPLWLRGDPQSLAFGGLEVRGDTIELRVAVLGKIATFSGERPVPLIARSMPPLKSAPASVTSSHLIVPVELPYEKIVDRIKQSLGETVIAAAKKRAKIKKLVVNDVSLFPSNGRLTMALGLDVEIEGEWRKLSGSAYIIGTPGVADNNMTLTLKLAEFSSPTPSPSLFDQGRFILPEEQFVAAFQKGVGINLQKRYASVLEDVNTAAQAKFADSNKMVGRFEDLKIHSIETRENALRIYLDLAGSISVYPGSANVAVGQVEPSSSPQ